MSSGNLVDAALNYTINLPIVPTRSNAPAGWLDARSDAPMIQLTRLNNHPLTVNSDLIMFVEQAPDTVLTLVTGEKVVVLESSDQVLQKIVEFRRLILAGPTVRSSDTSTPDPTAAGSSGAAPQRAEEPAHGQE